MPPSFDVSRARPPLFIADAVIFTGTERGVFPGHVLVRDGLIEALGPDVARPADAEVLDAGGGFLMAGLIDAHTHLALPPVPERPEPHPDVPFHAVRAARTTLASGVTTVRDVGGNNHVDLALKRAIARGDTPGPRVIASGQAIVPTGGHIHYFCAEADGPDAVTAAARRQIKAGADWIKLMISGGIANIEEQPDELAFTAEEIAAAVNAAAARGRRVAVHAYPARAIRVACEVGVATIEHAVDMDEEAIDAIRRAGAAIVPTHAVYEHMAENRSGRYPQLAPIAQRVLARKTAPLEAAIAAGVTVGVGTDCGRHYPYDGIAREMELLEAAGMSREGVLLAATRGNAEILGIAARVGTLVPGMAADIILLGASPLEGLAALRGIHRVIQAGTVHDPATLRL